MKSPSLAGPTGFAVLLADADPEDVIPVRHSLESLCLLDQLKVLRDGRRALAYLQGDGSYADRLAHPFPNILLMAWRLPALSGLGLLCFLRGVPPFEHLPVVMLSSAF